jgi:hypothetical protein
MQHGRLIDEVGAVDDLVGFDAEMLHDDLTRRPFLFGDETPSPSLE